MTWSMSSTTPTVATMPESSTITHGPSATRPGSWTGSICDSAMLACRDRVDPEVAGLLQQRAVDHRRGVIGRGGDAAVCAPVCSVHHGQVDRDAAQADEHQQHRGHQHERAARSRWVVSPWPRGERPRSSVPPHSVWQGVVVGSWFGPLVTSRCGSTSSRWVTRICRVPRSSRNGRRAAGTSASIATRAGWHGPNDAASGGSIRSRADRRAPVVQHLPCGGVAGSRCSDGGGLLGVAPEVLPGRRVERCAGVDHRPDVEHGQ